MRHGPSPSIDGLLNDLGVRLQQIHRLDLACPDEGVYCDFQQLPLPLIDMLEVWLKTWIQLCRRLAFPDGGQPNVHLELRMVRVANTPP
ncbi:MAG: hypothetical protein ABI292_07665 [Rhodoferax sp.]